MRRINGPIGLCYEGRKWRDILDADGNSVASSVPVDYATEIVKAVNCHADLLAACVKVKALIQLMHEKRGYPAERAYRREAQKLLTDEIANARGEQ